MAQKKTANSDSENGEARRGIPNYYRRGVIGQNLGDDVPARWSSSDGRRGAARDAINYPAQAKHASCVISIQNIFCL
jgi:hypothetical protein